MVCKVRTGRHRQPLEIFLQRSRVPAVKRQIELVLNGTEIIIGAKEQDAAWTENPDGLPDAGLPFLDMLEKLRDQTDVDRCRTIRQGSGASDIVADIEVGILRALFGDFYKAGVDIEAYGAVAFLGPHEALGPCAAANVEHGEGRFQPAILRRTEDPILDRCKAMSGRRGQALLLVVGDEFLERTRIEFLFALRSVTIMHAVIFCRHPDGPIIRHSAITDAYCRSAAPLSFLCAGTSA